MSLPDRFTALESKLAPLTFDAATNEVVITGANLRIINGLGQTDCGSQDHPLPDCPNGLGNLFVGYNEPREGGENIRNGSHNVVVGKQHQFSSVGGLVVGLQNEIRGAFASISGGVRNTAAGAHASISGGKDVRQEEKEGWAAGSNGCRDRRPLSLPITTGVRGPTRSLAPSVPTSRHLAAVAILRAGGTAEWGRLPSAQA